MKTDANFREKHGTVENAQKWIFENFKEKLSRIFSAELIKLRDYKAALAKSKRFKDVKGPLYDVDAGWNPGYRVFQQDLMSPIPFNPFEEVHPTADVKIGTALSTPLPGMNGFMPYTWLLEDGSRVSVNPINFEMERANAMFDLYKRSADLVSNMMLEYHNEKGWFAKLLSGTEKNADVAVFERKLVDQEGVEWRNWNTPYAKKKYGYQNEGSVLYRDTFERFYNRIKSGEVNETENTMTFQ